MWRSGFIGRFCIEGKVHRKLKNLSVSTHPVQNWEKFRSSQNSSGASKQNSILLSNSGRWRLKFALCNPGLWKPEMLNWFEKITTVAAKLKEVARPGKSNQFWMLRLLQKSFYSILFYFEISLHPLQLFGTMPQCCFAVFFCFNNVL